ncbi:MAG: type II toxin-antitoxin system PemK/MazF family toxin [Bacteroidota bacterium]
MNKIIVVKFPFIENPEQYKLRPVLCLTKAIGKYKLVVVAYITTNIEEKAETDILLDKKHSDFKKTNLTSTSLIKLHKLATISLFDAFGELGSLSDNTSLEVKDKLRLVFNL